MGAFVFHKAGTIESFNFCPLAFFVILFFLSAPHPVATLVVFVASAVLLAAAFLGRAIASSRFALMALLIALVTSYPFAFLFERGNIEGTVWIPCTAGVYFFARKKYLAAALSFALATSIKPFPAMLFLLLLWRHRYREFLIGVAAVIAVSAASLAIIGPSFTTALQQNLKGFQLVTEQYVLVYRSFEVGGDHSLFSLIKQIVRVLHGWPLEKTISSAVRTAYPYYVAFAAAIFCASIYRLRTMPALNQIFGISVLMVLISPVNNDYTLIAIYIPWAILLFALTRPGCAIPGRVSSWLMICCAVLFTPQSYLLFGYSTTFGAQVKTIALSAILILSVTYPLPIPALDESIGVPAGAAKT